MASKLKKRRLRQMRSGLLFTGFGGNTTLVRLFSGFRRTAVVERAAGKIPATPLAEPQAMAPTTASVMADSLRRKGIRPAFTRWQDEDATTAGVMRRSLLERRMTPKES